MDKQFEACGHKWAWSELSESSGSLKCLDPIVNDQGIDQSKWPSDAELSTLVGRTVKVAGAGDANDAPEGIYSLS